MKMSKDPWVVRADFHALLYWLKKILLIKRNHQKYQFYEPRNVQCNTIIVRFRFYSSTLTVRSCFYRRTDDMEIKKRLVRDMNLKRAKGPGEQITSTKLFQSEMVE